MTDIALECSCGKVKGVAHKISPTTGRRVICYCKDCQNFAREIGREGDVLNAHGGTDIFQITPSQVEITEGQDQLRYLKLSEKGIYRWYTDCCKTPAGNMVGPKLPFVGIAHNFISCGNDRDKILGPVRYSVMEQGAVKPEGTEIKTMPPAEKSAEKFPIGLMIKIFTRLFIDKVRGKNRPNAFFKPDGTPISE
ncbi:hypothetical protein WH96_05680 [Kiloniella spongiae]|uniref:CENP-V/GFA domain-containing protein n=1 Tax=Kiloniella spongiae TaxID=1489064 RepID=A0A0H2MM14_9PROT|nr:DUF6151 family protein [Kiloniella spongiae]KLN61782.1 hypothetical protein WH96_05680 [Kiloniella spongiae]